MEIKQLVREREAVMAELVRVRNHLRALQKGQYSSPLVVRLAKQRIRLLERQVKALEKMLHDAFTLDTALQAQLDLLMSVPGYGFMAAATVLAETDAFRTLDDVSPCAQSIRTFQ